MAAPPPVTNMEATVAVLAAHREARMWNDEAVATDLVAQLGLDPAGTAAHAKPVVMPGITEDEVLAHEAAAKEAVAKAKAARDTLNAQKAEGEAAAAALAPFLGGHASEAAIGHIDPVHI